MSDAISEIIDGYLNNVGRRLHHLPEDERVAIIDSLDSHIHEALASRCQGSQPTPGDVKAVMAEMDPPEAFGAESEDVARVSGLRWLRRTALVLAAVFAVCSLLFAYTLRGQRQLYIGRVKLLERQPSQRGVVVYVGGYSRKANRIAGAPNVYSAGFRRKATLHALDTLKLLRISTTPEALSAVTTIRPIPNTEIIAVEVIEPDREQAEDEAQALADGMQQTYSEMMRDSKSKGKPALKIIEEAHVYPVNMSRPSRVVGQLAAVVAQFSMLLLIFIGAAYLWAKVQDAARQR